mgnify:CR=1 FL=1
MKIISRNCIMKQEKKVNFFKWEKVPLLVIVVFLFVFLHILAVRSGIVILYFNLLVLFVGRTIQKKEYLKMLVIAVLIFTIPVVAYLSIPTFKQKIEYSILDFKMHQKNKEVAFSDGERFRSYEIGWELFESSPVTGVGVGDIFTDYQALYIFYFNCRNIINFTSKYNRTRKPHQTNCV